MNTNPKCIVNWTQPTLRWYRPKHSLCDYSTSLLHISKIVSTMHCGRWFLFTRGLLEIPTHITEYFCFMKVIGHGCLGRLQYSSVVYIFRLRLLPCSFSDVSFPQRSTFSWIWKINPLHSSNKNFWRHTFNSY